MPSRRNTLIGLGILAAGSTGAIATGAFSAATADRDVTASFEGDATAVLAFDPTSAYAAIDDAANGVDVLSVAFDNLSANADFTFLDTFRIINNGTGRVRLTDVGSGDDDVDWNNETDTEEPGRLLVANEAGKWQGNPNMDYVGDDLSEVETNAGYFPASDLGDTDAPVLESGGGWMSVGFRFQGTDGVGSWGPNDIPETLQLEFDSVTDG